MEDGELSGSRSRSSSRSGSRSGSRSRSRSRSRSLSRAQSRSRSRSRTRSPSRSSSRGRRRSRGGRGRGSRRSRSASEEGTTADAVLEEARLLFEASVVKLCEEHKSDPVPTSCVTCRLVTRAVKPAVLVELMRLHKGKDDLASEIPTAAARFSVRIDEKPPTLTLTEGDLTLAQSLFSKGKMSPASTFDDLTRDYLFLPANQNELLIKSIQLEQLLLKYKKDKAYTYIFQYVEQMAKVAKHLRIAERPIILAMGEMTRFMNAVRQNGKNLGFLYPAQPPLVQLLGPRKVEDKLTYQQLPGLPLPLSSVDTLLQGTSVSVSDKEIITTNYLAMEASLKEHQRDQSNKLGLFMDTVVGSVNRLDSFLGFHMDLYSHCDGELKDMMRDKAATLFNPSYRAAVKGGSRGSVSGSGLLGGESAVRQRLTDATKEDDLLAKTINKPQRTRKGGYGGRYKNKGLFLLFLITFLMKFFFQGRRGPGPGPGPGLEEDPDPDLHREPQGRVLDQEGLVTRRVVTATRRRESLVVLTPRSLRRRSRRMETLPSLRIINQVRIFSSLLPLHFLKHGTLVFSLLLPCS